MKLHIPPLASDIIISLYAAITLFVRFKLESETPVSPALSVVMGLCFLVILWVLIKFKILNPNWFGLFGTKKA